MPRLVSVRTLGHTLLLSLCPFRRLARFALYILTCVAVALSFFELHKTYVELAGESNPSVLKRQHFSVPWALKVTGRARVRSLINIKLKTAVFQCRLNKTLSDARDGHVIQLKPVR